MSTVLPGADRLRNARRIIKEADCGRDALLKAASEFWAATFDSHSWPVELQVKALPARFTLVRRGSFEETVRDLDEDGLRRLCDELSELADMADEIERRSA